MSSVKRKWSATFTYGYFEVFAYDMSLERQAGDDVSRAVDEALAANRIAGVGEVAVALFMPEQYSNDVSLEVVEYDAAPPLVLGDDIDACAEFDLDLPSGKLGLEEPANEPVLVGEVAPGRYRLRWLGLGFDGLRAWREAADVNDGDAEPSNPDHYRVELWPVTAAAPPVEHRRHPELDRK